MSGADKDVSGYIIDPTTRKVNMPAFRMLKAQSSLLNARAPITSLLLKVVANYGADEQLDPKTTERLNKIFTKALAKANAKFNRQGGFTFGPDSSVGDKVRGSSDAEDTAFLEDLIRKAQMRFVDAAQTGGPEERAALRTRQAELMDELKRQREGSSAEPVAKTSSPSITSQASTGSLGSSKQDSGRGFGLLRAAAGAAARAMTGTTRKGSSAGSADPEQTARDMDQIKDAAAAAAKLAARAGSPATTKAPVQTPAADRAARLAEQAEDERERLAAAAAKPKPRTPPPVPKRTTPPGGG